tara:strand:+ start:9140 stop:9799 length:660 start_codon:yes stop_codon:yes gene_type:complete
MKIPKSNLIVRCSSLHKIMGRGRSKDTPLSETAKSYIHDLAKEKFYGIESKLTGKFLDKGIRNEDLGIEMINVSRFREYKKNEDRITTDWLTGECDINTGDEIIDVKCSWSFDSFPAFESEAEKMMKKSGYDWQLRGYMYLYDKPKAEVVWCMTSTPDDLLSPYDDHSVHKVDHIDIDLRLTGVNIERDLALEDQMLTQYQHANEYYQNCIVELKTKNK